MALVAGIGQAYALDPREAGMKATNMALNGLGSTSPVLAIVISPYRFEPSSIISGVASMLSNVPVIGMSSSASVSPNGPQSHTVTVALLGGDIQAETHWFSSYSQGSADAGLRIKQLLGYEQRPAESVLVFGDGLNGNADELCQAIGANIPLFGGLSTGDMHNNNAYQFAGTQYSAGGLAAAFLRGNIKVGLGYAHGWNPVGSHFRVTRSRGFWLRTLDGRPASESYAHLFEHPAREWAFAPLNYMVRIYPLGFEQLDRPDLIIRSPLRVEADGSFRMNATLRDGSDGYLMVGSPSKCKSAAQEAAMMARANLGDARPVMAMVLADSAWQTLMQASPGADIQAVQSILGPDVPIAGGYTLGQIVPARPGEDEHPRFLNQHMVVALFGDKGG
jgi:hypothetical protein